AGDFECARVDCAIDSVCRGIGCCAVRSRDCGRTSHPAVWRVESVRRQNGRELHIRAHPVWLRYVVGALRLPSAHRRADGGSGFPERRGRRLRVAGPGRSVLALGRNASGGRLSDSAWTRCFGSVGIAGARISHLRTRLPRAAGSSDGSLGCRDDRVSDFGRLDSFPADGDEGSWSDRMKRRMTLVALAALKGCATVIVYAAAAALVPCVVTLQAHSGPPFPIVSNQIAGAYDVSIWTDPDATNDGSAAGQFWVVLRSANVAVPLPADTKVNVMIHPADGGPVVRGTAQPVNGDA